MITCRVVQCIVSLPRPCLCGSSCVILVVRHWQGLLCITLHSPGVVRPERDAWGAMGETAVSTNWCSSCCWVVVAPWCSSCLGSSARDLCSLTR